MRDFKKTFLFPLFLVISMIITSCGVSNKIKYFTITWKNYDGTLLAIDEKVKEGSTPTYVGETPFRFTDADYTYTFKGWEPEIEVVSQDQTYVAVFTKEDIKYNITYNLYGGINNPANPDTYTKNDHIVFKVPTKKGYTFLGWNNTNSGEPITEIEIHTRGDISIDAIWNEGNEYNVALDANTGSVEESNFKFIYDKEYQLPIPTKSGYEFLGWFDNDNKVEENGTWQIDYDVTLIAKWQAYKRALQVNLNDYERGTVSIIEGSGYVDEKITICATPKDNYVFSGWYKNGLEKINTNPTYTFYMPNEDVFLTAYFLTKEEYDNEQALKYAMKPVLSQDSKTITYGLYPQTKISDEKIINTLNNITEAQINGWYYYDETYYAKSQATPYNKNNVKLKFNDGTEITANETYWYKCEPITWKVISESAGEYKVISDLILDCHNYYFNTAIRIINRNTIYASNYQYSGIRSWLNDDFYNTAFRLNNKHIKTTKVINNSEQNGHENEKYSSETTDDKVFILSYKELTNSQFCYSAASIAASQRGAKGSDYARANGIYVYPSDWATFYYNGLYWSRSPISTTDYYVYEVNIDGSIVTADVNSTHIGVRPAITLSLY